jgi:hypothetical protein
MQNGLGFIIRDRFVVDTGRGNITIILEARPYP